MSRSPYPAPYGGELVVVTVTYFPGETLEAFLDSLAKATVRPVRVLLADNASTDRAVDEAAARDGVTVLRLGENLGYGAAANRGIVELAPEVGWVALANPDVAWHPGALDELLAAAERWPRAAALGPLIRKPDGSVYPSARLLPSLARGIGHALFATVWSANPWTRAYRQADTAPAERTAGWLSGSCLLLRRAAFESVDGFDPRYFMYFEDVDLADRLDRAGWLSVYVPSAEVTHLGGHATDRAPNRMLDEHHRSAYRYLSDRNRGAWRAPLRLAFRAGLAVRCRLLQR